jgi:hypothetical protein
MFVYQFDNATVNIEVKLTISLTMSTEREWNILMKDLVQVKYNEFLNALFRCVVLYFKGHRFCAGLIIGYHSYGFIYFVRCNFILMWPRLVII